MYCTYILYSALANRYYIGQTADMRQRLVFHRAGMTASTRHASDWRLVFVEQHETQHSAMAMERRIKRAKSRKTIERYIRDPRNCVQDFECRIQPGSVPTSAA